MSALLQIYLTEHSMPNAVTAANYSITVRGLPNVAFTERELMKHFAEVVMLLTCSRCLVMHFR